MIRDWKSLGLVLLALVGGYVVTRLAVGMFFESAVVAAIADEQPEQVAQSNTAPVAQPKAVATKAAPASWNDSPASNASGWSADPSWTQGPQTATPTAPTAPTPAISTAAPAAPAAADQSAASNTSRNAGP